ncbi:MAG: hypothetical protein HDR17_04955 [Lachnospiraceae bacterium]|nr:hypothetical protein [Lachnospiraceae bacterium]
MEERLTVVEEHVAAIEERLTVVEETVTVLESRLSIVENKVTDINLTLENEIRVNIKRVAEGHLDISRNLREALKMEDEKEMISVRVSILETEMRKTKERLGDIA